ncbi:hypothetical protein ASC87_25425 [Rhizobacter sp. Root1221]|nr:hypothetical protein ASC87_25425 [Rhizobacter sp. Root1221]
MRLLALPGAVAMCLGACALAPTAVAPTPAAATPAPAPSAPAAKPFATFTNAATTVQGGTFDGFDYAEKAGDAGLLAVTPAAGAVRVTGFIGTAKGSTWAGIGLTVQGAPSGAQDLSRYTAVRVSLASASAKTLRVRLVGTDAATLASGCYPVFMQAVTPQLRDYDIPMAAFAPEGHCGSNARTTAATLPAVVAIEVADPTVAAQRRDVDFQVGAISLPR